MKKSSFFANSNIFKKMNLKEKWRIETTENEKNDDVLIHTTSRGCVFVMYGDNVLRHYDFETGVNSATTTIASSIVAIGGDEDDRTIVATRDSRIWYVDHSKKTVRMLPYRVPDVVDIVSISSGIVAVASRLRATALISTRQKLPVKYLQGLERDTPTCLLYHEKQLLQGDVDGTVSSYDPRTESYRVVRKGDKAVRGLVSWNSKLQVRSEGETYTNQPFENYNTVVACSRTNTAYVFLNNNNNNKNELVCFYGVADQETRCENIPHLLRSIAQVTRIREETEREIEMCKYRLHVLRQTIETRIDLREGDWNRNTEILGLKLWGDVIGTAERRVLVRWKCGGEIMICIRNEHTSLSRTLRGGEDQISIPLDWNRTGSLVLRGNLWWRSVESTFVHVGGFELDLLDFSRKEIVLLEKGKYFSSMDLVTNDSSSSKSVEGIWRTFEDEIVAIRVEHNQIRIETETKETLAWFRDALQRRGLSSSSSRTPPPPSSSSSLSSQQHNTWKQKIGRVEMLRNKQNERACVSNSMISIAMDEAVCCVVNKWYDE
jgi:hypothetical protein